MNSTVQRNIEKKMEKERGKHKKEVRKASQSAPEGSPSKKEIEPPKLHRGMRLICDVFRISEQTRHALRSFDAATLEDFSFMTEEDFADMVVSQARVGRPIPPLQQRKLSVLLSWVHSLPANEAVVEKNVPPTMAEGFEVKESKSEGDGALRASYKYSPRRGGSTFVPADWESRFYADLPRLRRELREMGGTSSNWASEFLSLRWIFCG